MTLNNIKTMKKENGFTIVELLIVIVVIGILAAIVIVAYQGVTQRANTSKAQTNAVSVQKKAEAHAADSENTTNTYPATVATFSAIASTKLGAAPSGVTLSTAALVAGTPPTDEKTIQYVSCGGAATTFANPTGYVISYYNYAEKKPAYIAGGTATPGADVYTKPTTCLTPSSAF